MQSDDLRDRLLRMMVLAREQAHAELDRLLDNDETDYRELHSHIARHRAARDRMNAT